MRKFLTPEETKELFELGVPEQYATYLLCEDGRWASECHEMLTIIAYWKRTHRTTIFGDDKPVFSIGDLITYISENISTDFNAILEDQKFNFFASEETDNNELIDYLFTFIKKEYDGNDR